MAEKLEGYATLVGRILLCVIFLWSGIKKIPGFENTAGYIASKGMPAVPFFLTMTILFEILGGLSVLFGFKARLGAVALIIFLIPATLIFHNFWADPEQTTNFMKNVTIIGGLLMVVGFGPGRLSIDGIRGDKPGH